jgi:GTP-binding protein
MVRSIPRSSIIPEAQFLKSASQAAHYPDTRVPEIAFYGRSNCGKSSLINALVKKKGLVKTGSTPGMTQLINFFTYGEDLLLVDLPGYGYAKAPDRVREKFPAMMKEYFEYREQLKMVCLLLDIRRLPSESDIQTANLLASLEVPTALVLTKVDKVSGNGRANQLRKIAEELGLKPDELFLTSAEKETGLADLWKMIREQVRQP